MYRGSGEPARCDVCGRKYVPTRSGQKYCSRRCNQWAYDNRQRVLKKEARYRLTDDEAEDLRVIAEVSEMAERVVLRVSALAGRDLAVEVLNAVWDVVARLGGLDYGKINRD